jgi:hypothetical protein
MRVFQILNRSSFNLMGGRNGLPGLWRKQFQLGRSCTSALYRLGVVLTALILGFRHPTWHPICTATNEGHSRATEIIWAMRCTRQESLCQQSSYAGPRRLPNDLPASQ